MIINWQLGTPYHPAIETDLSCLTVWEDMTVSYGGKHDKTFPIANTRFHFTKLNNRVALFNSYGNFLKYHEEDLPESFLEVTPQTSGLFAGIDHYFFYRWNIAEVCKGGTTTIIRYTHIDPVEIMLATPQEIESYA